MQEVPLVVIPIITQVREPVYKCFTLQKLPTFDGSPDLTEAKDWLKKIQQIFTYMELKDYERVTSTVNQLEKETLFRWEYIALAIRKGTQCGTSYLIASRRSI